MPRRFANPLIIFSPNSLHPRSLSKDHTEIKKTRQKEKGKKSRGVKESLFPPL